MAKLGKYHSLGMVDSKTGRDTTYFFSDTIDTSVADDITSIQTIHKYGAKTQKDYKYWRDEIKRLVKEEGNGDVNTGFDSLTTTEKQTCCVHKIGSHTQRVNTVGLDNVVKYGEWYRARVQGARQIRIGKAINEVWNRVPDNAQTAMDDAQQHQLWTSYAVFGREGTAEGNSEGITDYLYGTVGTQYEGKGFVDYSWSPDGLADMQELCDKMYDILINGIY